MGGTFVKTVTIFVEKAGGFVRTGTPFVRMGNGLVGTIIVLLAAVAAFVGKL